MPPSNFKRNRFQVLMHTYKKNIIMSGFYITQTQDDTLDIRVILLIKCHVKHDSHPCTLETISAMHTWQLGKRANPLLSQIRKFDFHCETCMKVSERTQRCRSCETRGRLVFTRTVLFFLCSCYSAVVLHRFTFAFCLLRCQGSCTVG